MRRLIRAFRCWGVMGLAAVVAVSGIGGVGVEILGRGALQPVPVAAQTASGQCGQVPVGQANPSAEPEPMSPVWCVALGTKGPEPTTRVTGANDWVDTFATGVPMGTLNDGEMGYRVYNRLDATGAAPGTGQVQSLHFVNNNHWMVDMTHNNGGADLSPNRSFRFEGGKLVLEADVAAGIPGYGTNATGDIVWPEVGWSTAAAPTGQVVDNLYLYGQFGGAWASGCRLSSRRVLTCALEADHVITNTTNDQPPCFSVGPSRLIELSGFQYCGSTHYGGAVDFGAPADAWRQCQDNQMDMYCRDRFRFEWTQDSLTVYVNGVLFFRDAGWPADRQIPGAIVSGQVPVYAHFGEWGDFSDGLVYRFHWGRLAVNPHAADGSLLPPSAAPSYCPGLPQNTCDLSTMPGMPGDTVTMTPGPTGTMPMPMATATRTPTRTPLATWTATRVPLATATQTQMPTQVPLATATQTQTATRVPLATATQTQTATRVPLATATRTPQRSPTPMSTATTVPAGGYTMNAAVSPAKVADGGTVAITVFVTSAAEAAALVDIEVYSPAASKVFQRWFDNQSFSAGQTQRYTVKWSVPAGTPAGTYTVKVGVFSPGWGAVYQWKDVAARIAIT